MIAKAGEKNSMEKKKYPKKNGRTKGNSWAFEVNKENLK